MLRGLRYCIVSVGVATKHGARWAERDAKAIFDLLRSGAGPLDDSSGAYLLTGAQATGKALDACLAAVSVAAPDVVLFFYAGHANRLGTQLRDGLYPHTLLASRIAATGATRSLVVLDACQSGAYAALVEKGGALSGLVSDPDWQEALLAALPGPRVITATDRWRNTGEGNVLAKHGDLTGALLLAAHEAPADIRVGRSAFLTDAGWYARASEVLAQHGLDGGAQWVGRQQGLPVVRAEATAPIGGVDIVGVHVLNGVVTVRLRAQGRQLLRTQVGAEVVSTLTGGALWFAADWTAESRDFVEDIPCTLGTGFDDPVHRSWGPYGFSLQIRVLVKDDYQRILAHRIFSVGVQRVA